MSIPMNRGNITAEELARHPEWDPCELIEGEVVPLAPNKFRHMKVAGQICKLLGYYQDRIGRGIVGVGDPGLFLSRNPDTVRAPDVLFTLHAEDGDGFLTRPPELCVEAMSESNTWKEITQKAGQYLDFGVKLVWVVVPEDRTVHIFRPDGSRQQLGESETLTGDDVLEGFAVPVAELFV